MKSIVGIGLVALDVVMERNSDVEPTLYAGGSCGNVLSILSYLGMESFPIARLANNKATDKLLDDIASWGVKTDLILRGEDGSTPVIIQRLTTAKDGTPTHKFEFRNPETGKFLPAFKPVLAKSIEVIISKRPKCDFFYIDRLSRSSIELAKKYKEAGAKILFEPSSLKSDKISLFKELMQFIDIIKFSNDRIPDYKDVYASSIIPIEIETLGSNGLNYRYNIGGSSREWAHIPPFKLNDILDSAGAGDWTTAGIIKCIVDTDANLLTLNKDSIEDIILHGQALGAISCFYVGARGLMYNISAGSLDELVQILLQDNIISPLKVRAKVSSEGTCTKNLISSLLV